MFMIRTCAIWNWNAYVCTMLGALWLVHWVISLVNLHTDRLSWTPEPSIPGYGYCTVDRWSKYIGIAYLGTFAMDIVMIGLSAYRLAKMGKAVRSSFWTILFNDGISWCFLTICPTLTAIICFYLGKTIPTQSAALIVASTLHALLACRAYRKLSDFADTLPLSFCARDKVRNGTMLDADTLARLAWISGNPEGDVPLSEHVGAQQGDRHSGHGGSPGATDKERASMAPSGSSPALERLAGTLGNLLSTPRKPTLALFQSSNDPLGPGLGRTSSLSGMPPLSTGDRRSAVHVVDGAVSRPAEGGHGQAANQGGGGRRFFNGLRKMRSHGSSPDTDNDAPASLHSAQLHKGMGMGMGAGADSVSLDYGTGSAYYYQDSGSERGVYVRSPDAGPNVGLGLSGAGAPAPASLTRSLSARDNSAPGRGRAAPAPAIAGIQITTQRSYQEEEIDERARELDLAPHPHSHSYHGAGSGSGQFEGLRAAAAAASAASARGESGVEGEDGEDKERGSSSPSDAPPAPMYHAAVLPPSALSPSAAARRAQRGGGSAGSGR